MPLRPGKVSWLASIMCRSLDDLTIGLYKVYHLRCSIQDLMKKILNPNDYIVVASKLIDQHLALS